MAPAGSAPAPADASGAETKCREPQSGRFAIAVITAAFAVSRGVYWLLGYRFEMNVSFVQYLDLGLLRFNLLQSIYYLHSQPPLLNLFLGLGLKLFSGSLPFVFQIIFWAMGLGLALCLYSLMIALGIPAWLSLAAVLSFELGPATLIYEGWFYSTYPTAVLLGAAALWLNRFLTSGRRIYGWAFSMAAALPVFLNSSFQPVWFAGVIGLLAWFAYRRLRPVLPLCGGLFALMLALVLKNGLVLGSFATSSWYGMNFARITTFQLPKAEREQLVRDGELSSLALVEPFSPAVRFQARQKTGVPALDDDARRDGTTNYNSAAYLDASKIYLRDALWVVRNRPRAYWHGVVQAIEIYCEPAATGLDYWIGDLHFVMPLRRGNMGPWIAIYDRSLRPVAIDGLQTSVVLLAVVPLLLCFYIVTLFRSRRHLGPEGLTLLFATLAVLYVMATGVLLDVGENNRMRFVADPLLLVLAADSCARMLRARKRGGELDG